MDKLHEHVSTHINSTLISKDVPLMHNDDSKYLFQCSSCYRQFRNTILLKKHMLTMHKIQTRNLTEYTSNSEEENGVSHDLNDYIFLKTLLPDNYSYEVLEFKDLLFGRFKAKFQISHINVDGIINWLNDLSHKTKVDYDNLISEYNSKKNEHQMSFMCKNLNYLNKNTNDILKYPIKCTSRVSAVIHPMDNELVHLTKATILMKHKHYHPMNNSTPLNLYQSIRDVYIQLITLLTENSLSVSSALHMYKMKIINNLGKRHYLELMDSGVIPDVEFVYELYDMLIRKSDFSISLYKQMDILLQSVSFYNNRMRTECSTACLIENNIVVAIRIPQKEMANTDTVFVYSTIFINCKSWLMYSQNDEKIILAGIIIATDDKEYMLKTGLNLWKKLGGRIKTVIVEFIYAPTFQSVFPGATVCVSKFHFLLSAWKWLFNNIDPNIYNNELDCYVELKNFMYSDNNISSHYSDLNFTVVFIENYPIFKQFMQNIVNANFPFYSLSTISPCSTISERKLIYHHTELYSIVQMFHYVIYDVNLFYTNFDPNDQKIIFKDINKLDEDENNFIYTCIMDNCKLYLVQSVNGTYLVDIDIGLCTCTVYNICSPCIHQMILNKQLNDNSINSSVDIVSVLNVSDIEKEKKNEEFNNVLSEFRSVNSKIREQLVTDPNYFKVGIESFVSVLMNDLTSNSDLFSACHRLSNFDPHGLCNDQLKMDQS